MNSKSKFAKTLGLAVFFFILTFFYLHQKVTCLIQAYELSRNYQKLCDLVDKKDYLVYNFFKETSLAKVQNWTEGNNYTLAQKGRILALYRNKAEPKAKDNKYATLFNRFLGVSADIPKALARESD